MDSYLTLGALVASIGAILAIITFWMNLGKQLSEATSEAKAARAEADSLKDDVKLARDDANQARQTAALVSGKHDILMTTLGDVRVEFARDYVSHKALSATEQRFADSMDGVRQELTKISDRIYQILDRVSGKT